MMKPTVRCPTTSDVFVSSPSELSIHTSSGWRAPFGTLEEARFVLSFVGTAGS
jgi:hypothetical protein